MPVAMDMEAPLEVVAFNEVPEKEYAEAEPAAAKARAAETFIVLEFVGCVGNYRKKVMI